MLQIKIEKVKKERKDLEKEKMVGGLGENREN